MLTSKLLNQSPIFRLRFRVVRLQVFEVFDRLLNKISLSLHLVAQLKLWLTFVYLTLFYFKLMNEAPPSFVFVYLQFTTLSYNCSHFCSTLVFVLINEFVFVRVFVFVCISTMFVLLIINYRIHTHKKNNKTEYCYLT